MAARSEQKSNDAIKELEAKDEKLKGKIRWLKLDLMSVKGCQQTAQDFLGKEKALHYLFNNAGIMAGPYKLTDDGIESQFATNQLGPFALTMKLLPLMQETAKADPSFKPRIINMSSIGACSRRSTTFIPRLTLLRSSRRDAEQPAQVPDQGGHQLLLRTVEDRCLATVSPPYRGDPPRRC